MEYKNRIRGKRNKSSGELFERACDNLFGQLRARNFAHIQKTPEPLRVCGRTNKPGLFVAAFTQQAQPDYQGTMSSGHSVVLEAKFTECERLEQARITPMQAAELDRHEAMGAVAAVLVCFNFEHYGLVPWKDWKRLPELVKRKSLKACDLVEHGWLLDNSSVIALANEMQLTLWTLMLEQRERILSNEDASRH
jgi:recombination protein U